MRIISGYLKGRRLPATELPARPTTDMAKEALFDILKNLVDYDETKALDLFAGTGNISYEMISRGCKHVLAVEKNPKCAEYIREVGKYLKIDNLMVLKTDVFQFLKTAKNDFDLIFADPPYDLPELASLPSKIFEAGILRTGGWFILEHPQQYDFSESPFFHRHRNYGKVNFTFFYIDHIENEQIKQ